MAQGEVKCRCDKVCGSPNALWTHIQGKALHGDAEHQAMYSEDGFDELPQEDETEESEDKQEASKGDNILDDYRENVENEEETSGEQVKQLESEEDETQFKPIGEIDMDELPNQKVRKALKKKYREDPEAEIEINTDKNWMKRQIK